MPAHPGDDTYHSARSTTPAASKGVPARRRGRLDARAEEQGNDNATPATCDVSGNPFAERGTSYVRAVMRGMQDGKEPTRALLARLRFTRRVSAPKPSTKGPVSWLAYSDSVLLVARDDNRKSLRHETGVPSNDTS